jgi:hypothetical protein
VAVIGHRNPNKHCALFRATQRSIQVSYSSGRCEVLYDVLGLRVLAFILSSVKFLVGQGLCQRRRR